MRFVIFSAAVALLAQAPALCQSADAPISLGETNAQPNLANRPKPAPQVSNQHLSILKPNPQLAQNPQALPGNTDPTSVNGVGGSNSGIGGTNNPPSAGAGNQPGTLRDNGNTLDSGGLIQNATPEGYTPGPFNANIPDLLPGLYKGATIPGEIPLRLPAADELMSVGAGLPAIKLEASFNQPISLRDTLIFAAANNLPINIARENQINSKWLLVAQAAGSLPDVILNYTQQILQGQTLVQGVIPTSFHTPNVTMNAGFRVWGSKGGAVVFGTMAALHNYKAVKAGLRTTISDQFLALASGYYNLVLQQALMQVQVRAVATSRAQVDLNTKLERAGTGTRFNVLQSETQLATDEQNLLNQEVAFRRAAINLAALLNLNMSVNLMTVESDVRKVRLVDPSLAINDLLRIAIDHRPELKQYEQLRLAAKRQIQVAAAPLYPQMNFFGTVTGSGATLTDTYRIVPGQIQIVPISGPPPAGTPFNKNVSQPLFPVAAVQTQPQVQQRYVRPSYALGINMTWNHLSLNVPTMANVMAARTQARIAMLNSNQQLINVIQQVRTAYINSLLAERQVDVTSTAVVSSSEQLRLARVRLENGVGTNLDVITAQQAYTQALINKANAILAFNITQAQLIHDVGMTSVETLTSGRLLKRD